MRRALVVVALASGCSPAFDDLRDAAWSQSHGPPDGVSSADYGIAVASVDREQPGATLVIAGADPAALVTMSYDDRGQLIQTGIEEATLAFGNPPMVAGALDPIVGGDGVFAIASAMPPAIVLYDARTGAQGPAPRLTLGADACGGDDLVGLGGALMFALTGLGAAEDPDLIALAGEELIAFPDVEIDAAPVCLRCRLTDALGQPTRALDLVAVDVGGLDGDELALSVADAAGGPSVVFVLDAAGLELSNGGDCLATSLIAGIAGAGEPDLGTRLAIGDLDDDGVSELAATAPSSGRVYVYRELSATGTPEPPEVIPAPAGAVDFGAAAVFGDFDGDGGEELAIADPSGSPATISGAGTVTIYGPQEDGSLEPRATLHDSTPVPGQRFGRALTVAEFIAGGDARDLLVVGAVGEVFTYFQTVSGSDDPRQ